MDQLTPPHASDPLAEAIAAAIAENRVAADGRAIRRDGWTAERIRIFLEALADRRSATSAAREAGVSARSAYKLRNRAPAFDSAWCSALEMARPVEAFYSRVLHGSVRITIRKDGVCEERHYFDNRLAMAALRRLDRVAERLGGARNPLADHDFETLVELACAEAASPSRSEENTRRECPSCELSASRSEQDGEVQEADCHPELVSGSSFSCAPEVVTWMLKRVQHDENAQATAGHHARAFARWNRPFREHSACRRRSRPNPRPPSQRRSIITSDSLRRIHNLNLSHRADTLRAMRRRPRERICSCAATGPPGLGWRRGRRPRSISPVDAHPVVIAICALSSRSSVSGSSGARPRN